MTPTTAITATSTMTVAAWSTTTHTTASDRTRGTTTSTTITREARCTVEAAITSSDTRGVRKAAQERSWAAFWGQIHGLQPYRLDHRARGGASSLIAASSASSGRRVL